MKHSKESHLDQLDQGEHDAEGGADAAPFSLEDWIRPSDRESNSPRSRHSRSPQKADEGVQDIALTVSDQRNSNSDPADQQQLALDRGEQRSGHVQDTETTALHCDCHPGQVYRSKPALSRHLAMEKGLFQCEEHVCGGKRFGSMGDKKRHYRDIHGTDVFGNPVEPFCCPFQYCKRHTRGFARRVNLQSHIASAHGEEAAPYLPLIGNPQKRKAPEGSPPALDDHYDEVLEDINSIEQERRNKLLEDIAPFTQDIKAPVNNWPTIDFSSTGGANSMDYSHTNLLSSSVNQPSLLAAPWDSTAKPWEAYGPASPHSYGPYPEYSWGLPVSTAGSECDLSGRHSFNSSAASPQLRRSRPSDSLSARQRQPSFSDAGSMPSPTSQHSPSAGSNSLGRSYSPLSLPGPSASRVKQHPHSAQQVHKCPKCARGFKYRSDFHRHQRESHAERKRMESANKCPIVTCRRHRTGFPLRWNLVDHYRRSHGGLLPNPEVDDEESQAQDTNGPIDQEEPESSQMGAEKLFRSAERVKGKIETEMRVLRDERDRIDAQLEMLQRALDSIE